VTLEENISHLEEFMIALKQEITALGIIKRDLRRYPFDGVAEETISKTFALIRSVLLLLKGGQPEEAFGLARSIVECAMNLRWISSDRTLIQKRAFLFVRFGFAVKSFWYWWVVERFSGRPEASDADRYAAEWNIIKDPSGAFRHWSGERNFTKVATEIAHDAVGIDLSQTDLAAKRAIDYFHPSCFVHCSQPGLDAYFSETEQFSVRDRDASLSKFEDRTIFICHLYLHEVVTYALYGMNVHLSENLPSLASHRYDEDADGFTF
jgi:hypothetical protein